MPAIDYNTVLAEMKGGKPGPPGLGFGRANLGNKNLDSVNTPGLYQQNDPAYATPELNYPVKHLGILRVEARLLETEQYGPSVVQVFTPITGVDAREGQVHYERSSNGIAGFSAWRLFVAQRVDNTAGKAIYTWDPSANREQLIYGDTGWRALAFDNGYTGAIQIRRQSGNVSLRGAIKRPPGGSLDGEFLLNIPDGFHSDSAAWAFYPVRSAATADIISIYRKGRILSITGTPALANVDANEIRFEISWSTIVSWPTSLPGTLPPANNAGIPHL